MAQVQPIYFDPANAYMNALKMKSMQDEIANNQYAQEDAALKRQLNRYALQDVESNRSKAQDAPRLDRLRSVATTALAIDDPNEFDAAKKYIYENILNDNEKSQFGDPTKWTRSSFSQFAGGENVQKLLSNWKEIYKQDNKPNKIDEVIPTPQVRFNPDTKRNEVWLFTKEGNPKSFVRIASESDMKEKPSGESMALVRQTIKDLPKLKEDAVLQSNAIKNIDDAISLIDTGKVTGKSGQFKAWLAPYAESVGIKTDGMDDAAQFQAMTKLIRGPMRAQIIGPGQVSNYEQQLLNEMGGGGGSAIEAAKKLLNYYRQAAQSKIETYNQELQGAASLVPDVSKIHRPIDVKKSTVSKFKIISVQ